MRREEGGGLIDPARILKCSAPTDNVCGRKRLGRYRKKAAPQPFAAARLIPAAYLCFNICACQSYSIPPSYSRTPVSIPFSLLLPLSASSSFPRTRYRSPSLFIFQSDQLQQHSGDALRRCPRYPHPRRPPLPTSWSTSPSLSARPCILSLTVLQYHLCAARRRPPRPLCPLMVIFFKRRHSGHFSPLFMLPLFLFLRVLFIPLLKILIRLDLLHDAYFFGQRCT